MVCSTTVKNTVVWFPVGQSLLPTVEEFVQSTTNSSDSTYFTNFSDSTNSTGSSDYPNSIYSSTTDIDYSKSTFCSSTECSIQPTLQKDEAKTRVNQTAPTESIVYSIYLDVLAIQLLVI